MKRCTVAVAVLAVTVGFLAPAASAHGSKASTSVKITNVTPDGKSGIYDGTVHSKKTACAKNRKVTVFAKNPMGRDDKIGSVKAARATPDPEKWNFELVADGAPEVAEYYATVKESSKCKGATSALYPYF